MSQGSVGQEAIVTIEWPGGRIYRGKTVCASVEVRSTPIEITRPGDGLRSYTAGVKEWEMSFRGIGALEFTPEMAESMRSAIEWKCDWCGVVMPKTRGNCSQCGGQRSFLYDI